MQQTISPTTIVIQPSSFCNLNCRYCYVPDRLEKDIISDSLLERTIQLVLSSDIVGPDVVFLFHSGEPLSVGISFYKEAVALINRYNTFQKKISYSIQTNATLLNEEWISFFEAYRFEVGVSVDGPDVLHDKNRVFWNNKGSFQLVKKKMDLLLNSTIKTGALCTVTTTH